MESARLDKELVDQPQLWRLLLRIDDATMDVAVLCNVADNSLIYRRLALDANLSQREALENVIYDNPLLLSDFARIDIVFDTANYAVMPAELTDDDVCKRTVLALRGLDDDASYDFTLKRIDAVDVSVGMLIDSDVARVLRRTFNNPHFHHQFEPLICFFHSRCRLGSAGKMFAHLSAGQVDVIAFGADGLRIANRFVYREAADACYYILAARDMLKCDDSDELLLSGPMTQRDEVSGTLREYVPYVMAVFFPSAMAKAGADAMKMPFELIILPLCE
ncbi:MAG: DUF3822 family protein [Muribaculaceae bacterium]|nr:DUF3822 family protein [Muribaculaceae bacterium]